MTEIYDSTRDTIDHIHTVQGYMVNVVSQLLQRSRVHDQSKLSTLEKEGFDEYTPKLKGMKYGSDEYKLCLDQLSVTLQHHYKNNSHHPEHYKMWKCPLCGSVISQNELIESKCYEPNPGPVYICEKCCPIGTMFEAQLIPTSGMWGMDLFDLVEMLCDWKAATERHEDGDIIKSLKINKQRFEVSDQLQNILLNTVNRLGW